jgi:predicted dithiol-disulfide oxidoreductase (DUF899 family)
MMFPRASDDERPGPTGETGLLPLAQGPCPSCTALLDQLEGVAEHVTQRVNLVAVGKAPPQHISTFAQEQGWRRLRLLSSAGNTYNRDYFGETADGEQMPMLNVFHRDDATIRHFWARSCSTRPPIPARTSVTSAPSSRSGICSTSSPKGAAPTGTSSWTTPDVTR